ncbi:AEC family transporter [Xenorhabdus nematophila]|nr:AEC family transporter [Xenorhabdus nematophila]MBA0019771.1 AEC family transporter [Xenorhabdus nematophila]QNJ35432.1 AEC family transporter [Xenorhabdus nematophila]
MAHIITVIWPLFFLIFLGFLLKRNHIFSSEFWSGTEKLNYFILFPALLIYGLSVAPLEDSRLFSLYLGIFFIIGIASVVLVFFKVLLKWPINRFGVYIQGMLRFNTYLGLAITSNIFGSEGIINAALMIAIMVPLCNIVSVLSFISSKSNLSFKGLAIPIIKNPLILACVIGIFINITHIGLPFGLDQILKHLSSASLPLGLICIGASLQISTLRMEKKGILFNCIGRLLIMPLIAFLIAIVLGLKTLEIQLLVLFFAIPTAPTAYILTRQLNGDSQLMAGIITLQTILAIITLPIVLMVFMN